MKHNILNLDGESQLRRLVLLQSENNIERRDNLDLIPEARAVYAICGRVNGDLANPRYVGKTDNLQQSIRNHFDKAFIEDDSCFKVFVLSIKTKELVYQLVPDNYSLFVKYKEWKERFRPNCTEELNKIH